MIYTLLLLASILLSLPILMFCLEIALSLFPWRTKVSQGMHVGNLVVLIPAHNESLVISRTLETLLPTLGSRDRVLVIADNCSDDTAQLARQLGAEVLERVDPQKRGKGFALQFGLTHLAAKPPAAVVFLDADCQASSSAVRHLGEMALTTGRPVQGLYLCDADPSADPLTAVSALAFRFKNLARMLGLSRLGGVCYLTGAGMALPWPLVFKARLDGNVVEDMQWGIDLALAGYPPLFLPAARVNSPLPLTKKATATQRTRWEHGHLSTLLTQVPKLLWKAATGQRWDLLCLALDLAIPPLSLLVAMYLLLLVVTGIAALVGLGMLPLQILAVTAPLLPLAIAAGWLVHCRKDIPLHTLLAAPRYIGSKLPIYGSFLWKRQQAWVRTERDAPSR